MLWMQERALAFAEESESRFIHRGRSESPSMAHVQLLDSFIGQISKPWNIRAARLEPGERLFQIVLREVIVAGKVLIFSQLVVNLHRELVAPLVPEWHSLE